MRGLPSYPYLALSRRFSLPYSTVLHYADYHERCVLLERGLGSQDAVLRPGIWQVQALKDVLERMHVDTMREFHEEIDTATRQWLPEVNWRQ